MTVASRVLHSLIVIVTVTGPSLAQGSEADWQKRALASLAVIQGTAKLPGLHHGVRVQRDRWGVAHIYARDQHDLFFVQASSRHRTDSFRWSCGNVPDRDASPRSSARLPFSAI
jgi:acyl-homoserine lactone acylase PvdQ